MKKMQIAFLILLIVFSLFGCTEQKQTKATVLQSSEAKTEAPSPVLTAETEAPQVIDYASTEGFVTAESQQDNIPCKIFIKKYLKKDSQFTGYTLCIEVDTGSKILKKELSDDVIWADAGKEIFFADVDGDGIDEILFHYDTGGLGGCGIFLSWVIKVSENEILILLENAEEFDTGFENRFLDGYLLEVRNNFTGYNCVYNVQHQYGVYYDHGDDLNRVRMELDRFYVFEPTDVDGDGVKEILCSQYAWLRGHADCVGFAHSILKFNNETQSFRVLHAWFEPNFNL